MAISSTTPDSFYYRAADLFTITLEDASYAYSMKTLSTFRVTGSIVISGVPVHVEVLTNPNKMSRLFAIGFSFDGESFGALSQRLSGHKVNFLDVLGIDLSVSLARFFCNIFHFIALISVF